MSKLLDKYGYVIVEHHFTAVLLEELKNACENMIEKFVIFSVKRIQTIIFWNPNQLRKATDRNILYNTIQLSILYNYTNINTISINNSCGLWDLIKKQIVLNNYEQ